VYHPSNKQIFPQESIAKLVYRIKFLGGRHMVVGFTTTCAISAYHHYHFEFDPHSWLGVLDTLYDQIC